MFHRFDASQNQRHLQQVNGFSVARCYPCTLDSGSWNHMFISASVKTTTMTHRRMPEGGTRCGSQRLLMCHHRNQPGTSLCICNGERFVLQKHDEKKHDEKTVLDRNTLLFQPTYDITTKPLPIYVSRKVQRH